jgi:hypothetical protein
MAYLKENKGGNHTNNNDHKRRKKMKRHFRLETGRFFLVLVISLFTAIAYAENKVYLMTGEVSGIDMAYNTVVIEVPLGSQMFTVGGPLDPNATLTKAGRPASLKDFKVGETVKVKWRSTPEGHVIEALSVR